MNRFGSMFRHMLRNRVIPYGKQIDLTRMQTGQSGVVIQILGRRGMVDRLSALGIRPGIKITKVSSMFMRGPVTIQLGSAQVAIGFGMAHRIIVEANQE